MSFKYHRSYIIALVTLHEAYKLWSSSSCNYLHSLLIQSLPCPNISVLTSPNYRIFDILASYSGDFGFCSRSGGRLSWWGISWFLLSPSRQTVGHYIKVGPDHFLSYPFQFIIHNNPSVPIYTTHSISSFVFTSASRTALGPTQPPIQWEPATLSLGVKRPGREADHSPPSSAEAKTVIPQIRLHAVVLS
jgi:hypothetical protein